jgi:hypothetical protein
MPGSRTHIEEIHRSFRAGRLEYLVGAGASMASGLPGWSIIDFMSGKIDRLEIRNGFFVVSTRAPSAFKQEVRKEAQRIASSVMQPARRSKLAAQAKKREPAHR